MDRLDFLPCIQRVVLLIDLHPLFSSPNPNPNSYLMKIYASITNILAAPQLVSSLSALKFFFSSLSPVFSTSKTDRIIGTYSDSLSFNHHSQTLISLRETLDSLSLRPNLGNEFINGYSNASLIAKTLLQIEQYVCDRKISDEIQKDWVKSGSNLVILFSPVSQDPNFLAQFVNLEVIGDLSVSFDDFSKKFSQFFSPVKERLNSKDIHLSWVGVDFEFESKNEIKIINSNWIERVFKEHNWGFSSTDMIILGSSIIPIGLIFPYIGSSIGNIINKNNKKAQIDLILEISDVSGNPLECKICDLELLNLKVLNEKSVKINTEINNSIQKISKIQVKGVTKTENISNYVQNSLSILLIHVFSSEILEKNKEENNNESFFIDQILELLCTQKGEFIPTKPIWQLFLSFLYNKNYSALVLIPDINGIIFEGIIIPFTINHCLIYILKNGSIDFNDKIEIKIEKKRRKKGIENLFKNNDLNSFRKIILSKSESGILGDLCDFYLLSLNIKQKKLKFFKCWINQVREIGTSNYNEPVPKKIENNEIFEKEKEIQEIEKDPIANIEKNEINKEMESHFGSNEEIEEFIINLEDKIESGLNSKEFNLGVLCENLVRLSMQAIIQKDGGQNENVALGVSNVLFKKPKDLIAKYKGGIYDTNYKIKEHELQILFRMEILKSELGSKIEEKIMQKMVEDICAFLEFIDINLQMDSSNLFSSLLDFTEKSLKSRYNNTLPTIIEQIYSQMEFNLSEKDELFYSNNTDSENSSNPSIKPLNNNNNINSNIIKKEIMNAKEKRERNRRLSFITSWVPDFKRVWALKQPKIERFGPEILGSGSNKRKKRRISSKIVVTETPMTGTKGVGGTGTIENSGVTGTKENRVCRSLNKVLFCEEDDLGQDLDG